MDKRILIYIILGISLNTLGLIIMLLLENMYVALPLLVIGLAFTLMAVLKAIKGTSR